MDIIYRDENISLKIGDFVSLKKENILNESKFYPSNVGKLFENNTCDEILIEAKQYEWLEVYFETKILKNGNPLTMGEYYNVDKNEYHKDDYDIYTENSGYHFMRYILLNGGVKI